MCMCVFRLYFFIDAHLINIIDIFCLHFYFDPFKLPYGCYDIQLELTNKFSIFDWFPSTFRPLSGHYQEGGGCILQKYNPAFSLYRCNFFLKI